MPRDFAPLDQQPVIRQNRDTFYSVVIADISQGAVLTLPDAGDRYLSAMVINQDHYINRVLHEAGDHDLTVDEYGSPFVGVGVRILVDPHNEDDVFAVRELQDQLVLRAGSDAEFLSPDYDPESCTGTRQASGAGQGHRRVRPRLRGQRECRPGPPPHRNGSGLRRPPSGGSLLRQRQPRPARRRVPAHRPGRGACRCVLVDLPVQRGGLLRGNPAGLYSVNSVTASRNDDGTVTVNFGGNPATEPNCLPIMDGWNYLVRFYRPRPEILDRSWSFPAIEP